MITYYSGRLEYDLCNRNEFHLVYGTVTESILPNHSLDFMYSSATLHFFDHPEAMLQDLRQKLRSTGKFFIKEGFRGDHGLVWHCLDRKCGKRLYSKDELITAIG